MDLQAKYETGEIVGLDMFWDQAWGYYGIAKGSFGSLEASEHLCFHRDKRQRGHSGLGCRGAVGVGWGGVS